jgi:hypothetical protein
MVSRYRGESASLKHQEGKNFTCTEIKLSKTDVVLAPDPWLEAQPFPGNESHRSFALASAGIYT